MKLPIVFLAVLGLVCGKSLPTHTLQDDLNDFLVLVPTDKVHEISLDYLANDPEVQEAVAYLQSEEFHMLHTTVEDLKEFKDFTKFMNDLGVDVYELDNQIHDILGLPPFQPKQSTRRGFGLNGLIDDVINVLPVHEFKALFDEKMQTSPVFQALVAAIQSPEFVNILDTLRATPEYKDLLRRLQEKGFDVDHFNELFRALFGLSQKGTPTLQDDLNDFLALVPMDKILKIVLDYLSNDKEVSEFVVRIQSEEFPKIHALVEHLKEYKDCSKFNNDHAVDVYVFINEIHGFLGLPPLQPTNARRMGVGIYGLIEDVIAVLPLHDLKALFEVKMETREYFKVLVTCIRSPVFMKMLDTVRSWPEYYELLEILRDKVVDVDRIIELFKDLYWRGTNIVKEDLKEFMVLVPNYKVIQIILDYLANDTELHQLSAYIQSKEFPKIHTIVEYLKEYKDCFKFINDHGFDVYAFILEVYDILGLPPLPPTNITRMGVGVYGLVEDVIALLPLRDLKALFDVKMETRKYFKTFVTTIHSPLFLDMVDTVRTLPEYKKLLEILREKVVYMDLIIEILRELWELFGLPPL